jgi:hypothetical protein
LLASLDVINTLMARPSSSLPSFACKHCKSVTCDNQFEKTLPCVLSMVVTVVYSLHVVHKDGWVM